MSDPSNESRDAASARSKRNWILAGVLIAFVVLVFAVTIVRLGGHASG